MNTVLGLFPEGLAVAGADPAAGRSTKDAALAWRREMERQQQQSWFQPPLPVAPVTPWLAPSVLTGALSVDDRGSAPDAPTSLQAASSLSRSTAERGPAGPVESDTCDPVDHRREVPAGERAPSSATETAMRRFESPTSAWTGNAAACTGCDGAADDDASTRLTQRETTVACALASGLPSSVEAVVHRLVGTVPAGGFLPDPPVMPMETGRGLPSSRQAAAPFDEDTVQAPDVARRDPPVAATASREMPQPPLRVHCDWQDGQLVVWIGHDRGHAGSAAGLVQAVERWLMTQRLAAARFVVNGEPLCREGADSAVDAMTDRADTFTPRDSTSHGPRGRDAGALWRRFTT